MKLKSMIWTAVVTAMMSAWLVQSAEAAPVRNIGRIGPEQLAFMCRVLGGTYRPPVNGFWSCELADGSIVCDADGCESDTKAQGGRGLPDLSNLQLFAAITKLELELKKVPEATPPDLVPLPTPGSIAPWGFCRRNDQGQLLVNIYNQGTTDAADSKTRIVFGSAEPTDVDTPAIAAGTGTEIVVSIPNACFDANNNCSFTIGADALNAVIEFDEANNNAAGICGPQFQ